MFFWYSMYLAAIEGVSIKFLTTLDASECPADFKPFQSETKFLDWILFEQFFCILPLCYNTQFTKQFFWPTNFFRTFLARSLGFAAKYLHSSAFTFTLATLQKLLVYSGDFDKISVNILMQGHHGLRVSLHTIFFELNYQIYMSLKTSSRVSHKEGVRTLRDIRLRRSAANSSIAEALHSVNETV